MGIEREKRERRKFLGEFRGTFRTCNVQDSTKLGYGKLQV
jgi:hypothetical protein